MTYTVEVLSFAVTPQSEEATVAVKLMPAVGPCLAAWGFDCVVDVESEGDRWFFENLAAGPVAPPAWLVEAVTEMLDAYDEAIMRATEKKLKRPDKVARTKP